MNYHNSFRCHDRKYCAERADYVTGPLQLKHLLLISMSAVTVCSETVKWSVTALRR